MSIWIFRGLIVIGVIAAGFGIVLVVKHWGASEERIKIALQDKAALEQQYNKQFLLSTELQKQLADFRTFNQQLKDDLDAQIAKNSIYRTCGVPDDGVRTYNAALAGATASR